MDNMYKVLVEFNVKSPDSEAAVVALAEQLKNFPFASKVRKVTALWTTEKYPSDPMWYLLDNSSYLSYDEIKVGAKGPTLKDVLGEIPHIDDDVIHDYFEGNDLPEEKLPIAEKRLFLENELKELIKHYGKDYSARSLAN